MVGSRWLIRPFRTRPQSEPRGHVSSTRSPVAGVRLASEGVRSVPPVTPALHSRAEDSRAAERQRPSGHVRARESAASRLAWRNNRNRSGPRSPRAPDEPSAALELSLDGTSSSGSSSTTPSGPGRPFRLASVPRPGMTNTDVRRGTHPADQTRQGHPYARSITSRTLSRTNAHAYTDTDDNRAVGLSPRLRLDRSADRFLLAPLRNGVAWPCGVDERGAAGTLPGAAQGRRIPDPVPSASGPQIAATAVERRRADAPGAAGTVPGVAGRIAGIACRVRDRGVARAGLRSGSVGTRGCRAAQRLRAGRLARRQTRCQQRTP